MELEFDVHVDANALYDYMLRHTFTKAAGILGSTAGALGIVAGMMQRYPIYVIFGAVSTGKSLILYTDKIHASIFPRKDLGEKQSAVIAMISSHMEPGKVQIRS